MSMPMTSVPEVGVEEKFVPSSKARENKLIGRDSPVNRRDMSDP